jgi:hypothetical protein
MTKARRGYLFAITTVFMLVSLVVLLQSFTVHRIWAKEDLSQTLAGNRMTYAWEDIGEDVAWITDLKITVGDQNITFNDTLPAEYDIGAFLEIYSNFLDNYYVTPDFDIKFIAPDGTEMDLEDIDSKIKILPQNIEYGYPDFGKRELWVTVPEENASSIIGLNMHCTLKNAYFNCDPDLLGDCNKWAPLAACKSNTVHRLYLNLSFTDAAGDYFMFPEHCFNIDSKSTANLDVLNVTAKYFIKIDVGPLPTVIKVTLQNTEVDTLTSILLNTTEFYINYLTKLKTVDLNYNTSRVDQI